MQVAKRDGRVMEFNKQRIVDAIVKAMMQTSEGIDRDLADKIASSIEKQLETRDEVSVYEIQDLVEKKLMVSSRKEVATAYITYRYTRDVARKSKTKNVFLDMITSKSNPLTNREGTYQNIYDMMNSFAAESIKPYVDTILLSKDVREAEKDGYLDIRNKRFYPTKAVRTFQLPFIHETEILKNCPNVESAVLELLNLFNQLKLDVCESILLPPINVTLKPFVKKTYKEEKRNISELLEVGDVKSNANYMKLVERNVTNRVHNALKFLIQGLSSSCKSEKLHYITYEEDTSQEGKMILNQLQQCRIPEIKVMQIDANYSYGRGIVNAIAVCLPKIAEEAINHTKDTNLGLDPDIETNEDKVIEINFVSSLKKYVFVALNALMERLEFQSTATKSQFPILMSGLWEKSETLSGEETLGSVLKNGFLELELYGWEEAIKTIKKHADSHEQEEWKDEIQKEISNMLKDFSKEYEFNFILQETKDNN